MGMALTLRLRRFAIKVQLGKTNRFLAIWRGLTYGKAVLYCAFRALLDIKVSCVVIGHLARPPPRPRPPPPDAPPRPRPTATAAATPPYARARIPYIGKSWIRAHNFFGDTSCLYLTTCKSQRKKSKKITKATCKSAER